MKILVVYYSRTSVTRQVAQTIAKAVNADIEEIVDCKDRSGIGGFIKSSYEAVLDKLTKIKDIKSDLTGYDLVAIGTPVWAGKPSTPVTTFVKKYGNKLNRYAVFLTHGDKSNAYDSAVAFLERAAGKKAARSLSVSSAAVKKKNDFDVISFANELNRL